MQFVLTGYLIDTAVRELRRGSETVAVEPQVLDLLIYLVENRDRVVSKDELIASVWGGRIASDASVSSRIYAARQALGDNGRDQKLIRTIARQGHRFVGAVDTRPACDARATPAAVPSAGAPREMSRPAASTLDRPVLAVLPFVNMSGDPEQEYFSDGISEDIITALSKLRWFFVIARHSSSAYKGKAVHIRQVAEELGAGYVLEGSVRTAGDRVHVTAKLNDGATGGRLWAERYDRTLSDVFAGQDEITAAIVAAIEPPLYAAENFRARRKPADSMGAWDLVMRALSHFWRLRPQDNAAAQALLEKAIAIDPGCGRAHGVLAASHTVGAYMGWTDVAASGPIAERAAAAAVDADREDPWAQHALACVHLLKRRFEDSLAAFERALRLNPNFVRAQAIQGLALAYVGDWKRAIEAARSSLRLSPRDPSAALCYGVESYARFVGGDYREALRLAREAVRLRGDYTGGHRLLTAAAAMAGEADVAHAALQALRRVQPGISLAWIAEHMPIGQAAELVHYVGGFRRAGLE
ncbi:MAG TPA: winged helix-turn-helix domain-containing tetratricopeptide repeat protein [Xanthobacteraceae bacterium]|nr:winged helix-turn-helix domain-containing tetratricopeptide repeat protein [Xanthobacteraceae bacterium]